MINHLFKTLLIALFVPMTLFANSTPESVVLTVTPQGEIVDMYATSWTNGNINQFYLDFAHTQKVFNDIELEPGRYKWEVQLRRNNGKKGKMNFDVKAKYQNGSNDLLVDRKLDTNRAHSGYLNLSDYRSKSSGSASAGYGMLKIHVGRVAANTNCNYKITLTKVGGSTTNPPTTPPGYVPNPPTTPPSNSPNPPTTPPNNSPNPPTTPPDNCNNPEMAKKSGNVVSNTRGKLVTSKKACKDNVTVKVKKTGGKAHTIVTVYKSTNKNGNGQLVGTMQFARNCSAKEETIRVNNAKGYFIRVEIKNKSAINSFKYDAKILQ